MIDLTRHHFKAIRLRKGITATKTIFIVFCYRHVTSFIQFQLKLWSFFQAFMSYLNYYLHCNLGFFPQIWVALWSFRLDQDISCLLIFRTVFYTNCHDKLCSHSDTDSHTRIHADQPIQTFSDTTTFWRVLLHPFNLITFECAKWFFPLVLFNNDNKKETNPKNRKNWPEMRLKICWLKRTTITLWFIIEPTSFQFKIMEIIYCSMCRY